MPQSPWSALTFRRFGLCLAKLFGALGTTPRLRRVAWGRHSVRRARRAHGGDRERGQQEGDGVVTLYVVVIHMSAPRRSLSKGARLAPRPFSCHHVAPSPNHVFRRKRPPTVTLNTRRKRLLHHKLIFYAPKKPASPNSTPPRQLPTGFLGRFANF
jgi:hypothetical protein